MTDQDQVFMQRAIELAARGLGRVSPNPPVGCVVVQDGQIVGEGWHQCFGEAHAEVNALSSAGEKARGATAYVTLMPCSHTGKTPPCTDALIAAGVARVVVAVDDPNPQSGDGAAILKQAGVAVETGICAQEAAYVMRGFLKRTTLSCPFVTLKYAMTLDGRIATSTGHSQWISCEESRQRVQTMRREHDAVLIGSGTVRADDPRLNVREEGAPQPYRVIVDSHCNLSPSARLFDVDGGQVMVCTTDHAPQDKRASLQEAGAIVISLPTAGNGWGVDLFAMMDELTARGISLVLCEGGAALSAGLVNAGLVDELVAFVAPKLCGGAQAPGPLGGQGVASMDDARTLHHVVSQPSGEDLQITARLGDWTWMPSA